MFFIAEYLKSNIHQNIIDLLRVVDQNNMQIKILKHIKDAFESKNINSVKKNNPLNFKKEIYEGCVEKISEMVANDKQQYPDSPISNQTINDYKDYCKFQGGLESRIRSLEKKLKENQEKLKLEKTKL